MCRSYEERGGVNISTEPGRHAYRCWRGAEGAARCCTESTLEEVQRGWRGWLERPAIPKEPGAHQRVPWTAASSETRPGERTWLVQPVSGPLRSKGQAHAQEVPVEEPDRERVVPEAAQMQADPPIGCCMWMQRARRARRQRGWLSQPSRPTGRGGARRTAEQRRADMCRQARQRWRQHRRRAGSMALMKTAAGESQHQWRYVPRCG
jgi:hypothetical protein